MDAPVPAIAVSGLTMAYGSFVLQRDLTFTINRGDIFVIMGGSGCGKSTLLRHMIGLKSPAAGSVRYGDADFWALSEDERATIIRRAGVLYQSGALWSSMTLAENVAYATTDKEFAAELLELFGIAHLARSRPTRMSGGERQRGALCQALARHPRALLLDEPFSALDAANRVALRKVLLMVRDRFSVPIVHVTHDLAEAAMLGDQVLALRHGVLDQDWFSRQIRQYQDEQRALLSRFGPITPTVDHPIIIGGIA